MRDAVIVSTARTPLTKAGRGSFNNTLAPTLGAHSVRAAVERAGLDGGEIADVLFGAAMQQGSPQMNVARLIASRAGLPAPVKQAVSRGRKGWVSRCMSRWSPAHLTNR